MTAPSSCAGQVGQLGVRAISQRRFRGSAEPAGLYLGMDLARRDWDGRPAQYAGTTLEAHPVSGATVDHSENRSTVAPYPAINPLTARS